MLVSQTELQNNSGKYLKLRESRGHAAAGSKWRRLSSRGIRQVAKMIDDVL